MFKYAPVIIPTLNRYSHLKRCLDSLSKNVFAKKTELYISVDYPPSEKYINGYTKVCELLKNYDFSSFSSVNVFYQEHNLGAKGNTEFLHKLMYQRYDRYIYSEDDNEFSPNFIEYIDKGLDIFEDDENVIAICGSCDDNWKISEGNNVTLIKLFNAYGTGVWINKEKKIIENGRALLMSKKTWNFKNMYSLFNKNQVLFSMYLLEIIGKDSGLFWNGRELFFCDTTKSIYMYLTNTFCVAPQVSKSRTWGNDGSGVNIGFRNHEKGLLPLDNDESFKFEIKHPLSYNPENDYIGNKYLSEEMNVLGKTYALTMYLIFLIFRKNRKIFLKFNKFMNKIIKRGKR